MKKNVRIYIFIFFLCFLSLPQKVFAEQIDSSTEETESMVKAYDFTEIEKQLDKLFPKANFDFTFFMKEVMKGNITEVIEKLFQGAVQNIISEIGDLKGIFVFVVAVGLLSALFSNFSKIFENHQIADISYYLLYLFLITVLLKTFSLSMEICKSSIENIVLFIRIVVPTFYIAIGISGGVLSATFFYQIIIVIIFGVESILLSFVVPIIYSYVFLVVINGITEDDKFAGITEMIKTGIQGILKISLALVTGFSILQSIITPVIDGMKVNAVSKVVSAIPGIGNIANSVTEMVIGSALLIKNSIGVLLLCVLIAMCFSPILKLLLMTLVLKGSAALIGMVCDKRMEKCARQVGEGNLLLLKTLITSMVLFLITVAIIAIATNKGY